MAAPLHKNILGLYKAFWYTGSAFTSYFQHSNDLPSGDTVEMFHNSSSKKSISL